MKQVVLTLPSFAFILSTRAALAAGVGLLVSHKLSGAQRRAVGMALVAIGAVTTIPAAMSLTRGVRRAARSTSSVEEDHQLIGATRFPRKGDEVV